MDKGFIQNNTESIICNRKNYDKKKYKLDLKYCERVKFAHNQKGGYMFEKRIFFSKSDFCKSNEYFGSGWNADRLNIISKKVYKIIIENKLKGLKIAPIFHE